MFIYTECINFKLNACFGDHKWMPLSKVLYPRSVTPRWICLIITFVYLNNSWFNINYQTRTISDHMCRFMIAKTSFNLKTCVICTRIWPTDQSCKVSLKLHKWYNRSSPDKFQKLKSWKSPKLWQKDQRTGNCDNNWRSFSEPRESDIYLYWNKGLLWR
jgi:hypothetical protein